MPFLQRFRRPSLLRLLALCVLSSGMLAQSAMAAIGDVHELSHGIAAHADAHADEPSNAGDGGQPGEDSGLQHALMHAGHCCGPLIAMPMAMAWTPAARPGQAPASFRATVPTRRLDSPLRPPIEA